MILGGAKNMSKVYSYNRISQKSQSIERQIRNAKELYPNAIIVEEVFTGTKVEGRKEFIKLVGKWTTEDDNEILKGGIVKKGDTIVFDSVSRMSRNAEEGFKIYKELYNKIIERYENRKVNEDLFIMSISMQNHGGYSKDYENFEEPALPGICRFGHDRSVRLQFCRLRPQ